MHDDTGLGSTSPMVAALLRTELLERCDALIDLLIVTEQDARVAAVAPFGWAAGRALCDHDDPAIRLEAMAGQIDAILQVPEVLLAAVLWLQRELRAARSKPVTPPPLRHY